jgi:hypothetical protein
VYLDLEQATRIVDVDVVVLLILYFGRPARVKKKTMKASSDESMKGCKGHWEGAKDISRTIWV